MEQFVNINALVLNICAFANKQSTIDDENREDLMNGEINKAVQFIHKKYEETIFQNGDTPIPYQEVRFWVRYFQNGLEPFYRHEKVETISDVILGLVHSVYEQMSSLDFAIQNLQYETTLILFRTFYERCTILYFLINHEECINPYAELYGKKENFNPEIFNSVASDPYQWAKSCIKKEQISFEDIAAEADFYPDYEYWFLLSEQIVHSLPLILIEPKRRFEDFVKTFTILLPHLLVSIITDGFHEIGEAETYCFFKITESLIELIKADKKKD